MAHANDLRIRVMRSFLGRARGLGSSKSGFHHWWLQRVTSLALIPLTIWFVWSVVHLVGLPYPAMRAWAAHPVTATLLLALIATTFEHMHLGVQVVAEDYIPTDTFRMVVTLGVKAASGLLALAASIAVLKLAIAG